MPQTERTALSLLRKLTGDRSAVFRPHELKAIQALVRDRRRVLLVQRTGWGKSAVYFIATRLLRDDRAGPTMLMSPLLALMRNQIRFRASEYRLVRASEWYTSRYAQIDYHQGLSPDSGRSPRARCS